MKSVYAELQEFVSTVIFSSSGWRGVFAERGEEDRSPHIAEVHELFMAVAAYAFIEKLSHTDTTGGVYTIALGCDARPTGLALEAAAAHTLQGLGVQTHRLGVIAGPEIMAYTGADSQIDGFFYITASHNPIGHNGIKFGGPMGGVFTGTETAEVHRIFERVVQSAHAVQPGTMAATFRGHGTAREDYTTREPGATRDARPTSEPDATRHAGPASEHNAPRQAGTVRVAAKHVAASQHGATRQFPAEIEYVDFLRGNEWKRRAESAYAESVTAIAGADAVARLREGIRQTGGVGIVAELNGSARGVSRFFV
ncbi:MAG: hypothetical protein ACOC0D_10490 [Spirochaeta sp.]